MTEVNKLRIYKTPSCQPCKTAMRMLDKEGLPYSVTDVTEDPEAAARLKRNGFQVSPVFGYKGRLHDMSGFREILTDMKEARAA